MGGEHHEQGSTHTPSLSYTKYPISASSHTRRALLERRCRLWTDITQARQTRVTRLPASARGLLIVLGLAHPLNSTFSEKEPSVYLGQSNCVLRLVTESSRTPSCVALLPQGPPRQVSLLVQGQRRWFLLFLLALRARWTPPAVPNLTGASHLLGLTAPRDSLFKKLIQYFSCKAIIHSFSRS
jgi:hypothetical protein